MGERRSRTIGRLVTLTRFLSMKRPYALIVLSATVLLLACGSPTTTPAATATSVATVTPTPVASPTPAPTPTPAPETEALPTATPQVAALFDYSRAVHLTRVQEWDDAIASYGIVIRKLPNFALAYHGRGRAYFGDERFGLAMEDFDTAIKLEPDFGGAYAERARVHIELGNTEAAVKDLELAIQRFHPLREGRLLAEARELLDSIRP